MTPENQYRLSLFVLGFEDGACDRERPAAPSDRPEYQSGWRRGKRAREKAIEHREEHHHTMEAVQADRASLAFLDDVATDDPPEPT